MARRSALREVLEDRVLVGALAVLWICALLPIWVPRFLPLLDFPNHLGAIAILHRHGDPSWGYDQFYSLNLKPAPYWGHYFPVHLLAYLVPLEVANKLWIGLVALALPSGVAVLARQLGRSPWLALFAAPFVYGYCFALGFLSFCGGVALFPWALWALEAFLDEPTAGRGLALTLLACALYLMHVMPWVVFGLSAGIILCSHGWRPRRLLVAAGCMLVSVVFALWAMRAQGAGQWATADTYAPDVVRKGGWMLRYETFKVALYGWKDRWLVNLPSHLTQVALALLAVSAIGLAVTRPRDRTDGEKGFRFRYELVLALCLLLYFELPQAVYKPIAWWYISGRMTAFIAVVALLWPRGEISGRRRLWLIPAALIAIAFPVELARRWHRYDVRTRGFQRLMKLVPRGSSTLVLMLGPTSDPDADPTSLPFLEFHSLAQVLSGGFDPWAQETPLGGFPMSPIPGKALPAPYYSAPMGFTLEEHGLHYDFVLTRNEHNDHALVPNDRRSPLVAADGQYRLYRIMHQYQEP